MELILAIAVGCVAMLMGFIGCFLPVLPGPAVAYAALFVLFAFDCPPSATQLIAGAVVLAAVTLMDYILPSVCAKRFNCSRWGVIGCFVGSIVGLFFLPLGIIFGPFLGTVAGELVAGKNLLSSVRGGFGALVGFVLCLGLKLVAVGLYAWWYFSCLPHSGAAQCP